MFLRCVACGCLVSALALPAPSQEAPGRDAQAPPGVATISPDQAVERARALQQAGQTAEALDLLKSTLKTVPGHVEALLLAAEILMASNDYDLARDYYKQALDKEPSNFKANLGTGKIYLANRSWRQAVSFLEKAENVAPQESRAETKRLLAGAYAQIAQLQKALDKALEAIDAAPDDLDALLVLVQVRQAVLLRDPKQIQPALADAEKYVQRSAQALARAPLERKALARLASAYDILVSKPPEQGILQTYHNSFYQTNYRGQPTDQLLPGKGADAAAVLMRIADVLRQQALLTLVSAQHDAVVLIETAVKDDYDAKNVKDWEQLALTYQQLEDLTARLVGGPVADAGLRDRIVGACRKVIELDPNNERARQYLQRVGTSPTSEPATSETQ
jgi:tetratricopeptide (TPR) repeat protein